MDALLAPGARDEQGHSTAQHSTVTVNGRPMSMPVLALLGPGAGV